MAFCPTCGSPIDAGSTTCARCAAAPPPAPPVYVTSPSPGAYPPGGFQPGGFQPGGFQPGGFQQGFGAVLPDPSPMAIILAAASWVVCGPFLSIPAVIIARSNMRGIREGRFNPNSMSMCQIAFWVAAANVGMSVIGLIIFGLIFGSAMFFAATVPHTVHPPRTPSSITSPASTNVFESVEKDVETRMAARPESERKLWRQTRDDLRSMRKQKGAGTLPEAKGLTELLRAVEGNEPLWTALTRLERQAAQESGRVPASRPRPAGFVPAEAPPGEEEEDD